MGEFLNKNKSNQSDVNNELTKSRFSNLNNEMYNGREGRHHLRNGISYFDSIYFIVVTMSTVNN